MMNDYQIAGYVVSGALRTANHAGNSPLDTETLIRLSGALSSAVSAYGYREQKAIRKAGMQISPDFADIADDFFLALKETPVIADKARSREYEKISEFVIENKELTQKERLALYKEQHVPASVKFWKSFRIVCLCVTILCTVLTIGLYLFQPEVRQQFLESWNDMKYQFKKTQKHAKTFLKAIKFLLHQITK
ncbi:MAG: hypothetical protein IJJ69_12180 [Oscillospiraceae bacterium]|nr:hypothetical protein [Oscillospiraceae bacterium]